MEGANHEMKTAIYIQDGTTQLVLTPESAWEKSALGGIGKNGTPARIISGSFYECQGGWIRQGGGEESLIIRVDSPPEAQ